VSKRGRQPPLLKINPPLLIKERGTKGVRSPNENLTEGHQTDIVEAGLINNPIFGVVK